LLVFLFCLAPIAVFSGCSCSQDPTQTPYQLSCTGNTQMFYGDTELYVGAWQTCSNTVFTAGLEFTEYSIYQTITLPFGGGFEVQGDLIIPPTTGINNTISFIVAPASGQTTPPNATLEIFGNLFVNGNFNVTVDYIIIHGNVTLSPTGYLTLNPSTLLTIHGNINGSQSNISFAGTTNNTVITIDGSLTQTGLGYISFAHANVTIQGQVNAPNSVLTIEAITNTQIRAPAFSVQNATLDMLPTDMGQSNLNTNFHILLVPSPITFPCVFEQEWTCGNYKVNATINTSAGLSIILHAPYLQVDHDQYCCFESIDSCTCAPYTGKPLPIECQPVCIGWICDTAGFVVGWVVGGVLATALLSVSCLLFVRDFIATL